MLMKILAIGVGAFLGAILRYLVALGAHRVTHSPLPWGTLIVNVVGCFLLGFLATLMIGPLKVSEPVRLMLTVGFLGGLTTFSSFGYETMALAGHGKFLLAGANILTNNVLSLVAVWVGVKMAQLV